MKKLTDVIAELPEQRRARIEARVKELLEDPEIKAAVHRRPPFPNGG